MSACLLPDRLWNCFALLLPPEPPKPKGGSNGWLVAQRLSGTRTVPMSSVEQAGSEMRSTDCCLDL